MWWLSRFHKLGNRHGYGGKRVANCLYYRVIALQVLEEVAHGPMQNWKIHNLARFRVASGSSVVGRARRRVLTLNWMDEAPCPPCMASRVGIRWQHVGMPTMGLVCR